MKESLKRLVKECHRIRYFLRLLVIKRRNVIVDKVSEVREWIKYVSVKRGELGGHAICPYAFSASVHIEEVALSEVTLIEENADVIIFIVGDCSVAAMMATVDHLNMTYRDYIHY